MVGKDIAVVHGAAPHEAHHLDPIEYATMALSLAIAITGILIARAMYQTKRLSPDRRRASWAAGALSHRATTSTTSTSSTRSSSSTACSRCRAPRRGSTSTSSTSSSTAAATVTTWVAWLDGLFDSYVVDGAVNGVGWVSAFFGGRVRRLQTGSINGYLYVIVIAVVGVMVAQLWWGSAPS